MDRGKYFPTVQCSLSYCSFSRNRKGTNKIDSFAFAVLFFVCLSFQQGPIHITLHLLSPLSSFLFRFLFLVCYLQDEFPETVILAFSCCCIHPSSLFPCEDLPSPSLATAVAASSIQTAAFSSRGGGGSNVLMFAWRFFLLPLPSS